MKQPVPATAKMYQMVTNNHAMKKQVKQPASNKMVGSNSHITILTLNVNGLSAPIKRHRLANLIKNQDPSVCSIQETHLTCKDTHRLKIKGWRKINQANGNKKKKAAVAILVSEQTLNQQRSTETKKGIT